MTDRCPDTIDMFPYLEFIAVLEYLDEPKKRPASTGETEKGGSGV